MLEYPFFDSEIRSRFLRRLRTLGVTCESGGAGEALLVLVPEDLDEELADQVDEIYDELLEANAGRVAAGAHGWEKNVAGIGLSLPDGRQCTVAIEPELLDRLLGCVSHEELRDLAQRIAAAALDPDERPLCQR